MTVYRGRLLGLIRLDPLGQPIPGTERVFPGGEEFSVSTSSDDDRSGEPIDFGKLLRRARRDLGPVFVAAYPGTCPECGDQLEGEEVRYDDGELMHADCCPDILSD